MSTLPAPDTRRVADLTVDELREVIREEATLVRTLSAHVDADRLGSLRERERLRSEADPSHKADYGV